MRLKERTVDFGTSVADPKQGEILVFVEGGVVQSVDFLCPCGCGKSCYTPVTEKPEPTHSRQWCFSRGENGVTLTPSIRYTGGCKTHFNITDGEVIVHADSGQ
jgi:hypothetical protein